jgi:hypothetical protein
VHVVAVSMYHDCVDAVQQARALLPRGARPADADPSEVFFEEFCILFREAVCD